MIHHDPWRLRPIATITMNFAFFKYLLLCSPLLAVGTLPCHGTVGCFLSRVTYYDHVIVQIVGGDHLHPDRGRRDLDYYRPLGAPTAQEDDPAALSPGRIHVVAVVVLLLLAGGRRGGGTEKDVRRARREPRRIRHPPRRAGSVRGSEAGEAGRAGGGLT